MIYGDAYETVSTMVKISGNPQFPDFVPRTSKRRSGRSKEASELPLDLSYGSLIWDNATRHRNPNGYYFFQCFDPFDERLHTKLEHDLIWERLHDKELPRNCYIHHRDLDPGNNNAENLMCIPFVLHKELHVKIRKAKKSTSKLWFEVERFRITQTYEQKASELMDLWALIKDI